MKNILSLFNKHSSCSHRYVAFTLAEVLITLGIIGIVAAMTIPTLVNKVQKHQYVVALKKFYSTQSSGWAQLLADEGVNSLEDTSVFQSLLGSSGSVSQSNLAGFKPFFDGLKKYFKFEVVTAPSYQLYLLKGDKFSDYTGNSVLAFPDGSLLVAGAFYRKKDYQTGSGTQAQIAAGGGHIYYVQGLYLYVDVNGFKKPNTFGRDIFDFVLSSDGKLYPAYGKDWSLFDKGDLSDSWQNNTVYCGTLGSANLSGVEGEGCASRIMEEGWEMNY